MLVDWKVANVVAIFKQMLRVSLGTTDQGALLQDQVH